jgi:hypothetical protein
MYLEADTKAERGSPSGTYSGGIRRVPLPLIVAVQLPNYARVMMISLSSPSGSRTRSPSSKSTSRLHGRIAAYAAVEGALSQWWLQTHA